MMYHPLTRSRGASARPAQGFLPLALAALLLAPATFARGAEEPKKILFFGNSFTIGNGGNGFVPTIVRDVASAAGRPTPSVHAQAVGGRRLDDHIAEVNADGQSSVIRSSLSPGAKWDFTILQEFSTKPTTHRADGNPADFRADADTLFGLVRGHSPAVKGVLFETWARGHGHSFYTGGTPEFPGGPTQMQGQLRTNYGLARDDLNAEYGVGSAGVAPVGDGFEYGNFSNLYNSDIYHANNRGSLLAGLILYSTIYGDDVRDINLTSVASGLGLTSGDAAQLANWADATTGVPEPAAVGLLAACAPLLLSRRRRR